MKNGGSNTGIVSTQDDSYPVYGRDIFNAGNDYTVTITVPASDEYLNIRWKGLGAFLPDNTRWPHAAPGYMTPEEWHSLTEAA